MKHGSIENQQLIILKFLDVLLIRTFQRRTDKSLMKKEKSASLSAIVTNLKVTDYSNQIQSS